MSDYGEPEIDIDLTPPAVGSQYHPAETEDVLLTLRDIIEAARPVPLSASSMIAKEEVLELIDEALDRLPEELRAARWLLKEREEFLARTRHEADEILDQARARAERMVQRTEVVKAAEHRAYQIVDAAEADARRLRHEVEDFCDQKLASFEIVLERTQKLVAAGRSKLQGANLLAEAAAAHGVDDELDEGLPEDDLTEVVDLGPGLEADDRSRSGDDSYDDDYDDGSYDGSYDGGYDGAGYDDWEDDERSPRQGRLTVAPEYADLPPPPSRLPERDAEATFFDQDLA